MRLLPAEAPVVAPAHERASVVDAGADVIVTLALHGAGDTVDAHVRAGVLEIFDGGTVRAAVPLAVPVEPGRAPFLRDGDLLTVTVRKVH